MKDSIIADEKQKVIGHIGGNGSYSHEAAQKYFKEGSYKSFTYFENVFHALRKGIIDYGVVPIENSSTGGIRDVYDLLAKQKIHIVGEVYLNIEHHLLGLPGASIEDIKMVCSHPQGLMQSSGFIRIHAFETKLCKDTGSAAAFIEHNADSSYAAIASSNACKVHKLKILAKNISNFSHNTTRFYVLAQKPIVSSKNSITSLVFATNHNPGCLYNALKHLSDYEINMLRIESRPMESRPWEYNFFVDIEGSMNEPRIVEALRLLEENTILFKILGSYNRWNENKKSCG